ncbi:peroxidasin-like isoform X2 [Dendronephthya gigantea]|uniref:peroxidasin-like isoform X2 n=1 Tax=Dendronephthya gigantea TaxID=151771 RepID=UPI00106C33F1|nr:peroxidasin-like isoform X2 [Dendronephthya gigantea]
MRTMAECLNTLCFILILFVCSSTSTCPRRCLCYSASEGPSVRCLTKGFKTIPSVPSSTVVLDLRFNFIQRIGRDDLQGLANLKTLLLDGNNISRIEPGAFSGLTRLKYLYLKHNNLKSLNSETFFGLTNLNQLFLSNNKIRTLQKGTFSSLSSKLKRLHLERNPLECSCDLLWLTRFLKKLKPNSRKATCFISPDPERHKIILLTLEDLNCSEPEFVKIPLDVVISSRPPSRAYFYCQATGHPTPTITWLKNRVQLDTNEHYVVLSDGTLEIHRPGKEDEATYHCLARNSAGQKVSGARLMYYEEEVAPKFIDIPEDTQVVEGNALILKCSSEGIPNPKITWSRNAHPITPSRRVRILKSGNLQISEARRHDHGEYTCRAQNKVGYITRSATLVVKTTPVFSLKPASETEVVEGTSASLPCRADGYPTPAMTWFKDGTRLPSEERHVILTTGSLRILQVQARDEGVYTCQAINVIGVRTARSRLVVKPEAKPEIMSISEHVFVNVGDSATLTCVAQGDPIPQITWIKDGIRVTNGNRFVLQSQGVLRIREIGKNDEGTYECVARNDAGSDIDTVRLTVRAAATGPGDRFVNSSILQAKENIDRAIQKTIQRMFAKARPSSPGDLLALFRFPSKQAIEIARAAEVFERTIQLIHDNVERHKMLNISEISYNYYDLVSPSYLEMIANLSGCTQHRRMVNCTQNLCYHKKYRTIDGTCNNLDNPMWGSSLTAFRRLLRPVYENGFNTPMGWRNKDVLPSARLISTQVISAAKNAPDEAFTHMLMQWGQFLDHDLDFTVTSPSSQSFTDGENCTSTCENQSPCFPISIPANDTRIKRHKCMTFTRSSSACGTGATSVFFSVVSTREQMNQITSYLDASNVYGSSRDEVEHLRDLSNDNGLLKTGMDKNGKPLLPFNDGSPIECLKSEKESPIPCFLAGDHRANEQLGLLSMHTIWMREHNRIAKQLRVLNPNWNGEKIFQETRKIVGAEMQHITYAHYLPKILGKYGMDILGKYEGYKPDTDASIFNAFATAAFRVGHSMIRPVLDRVNSSFQMIEEGHIPLHKAFFAPYRIVEEGGIDPLIRGLFFSPARDRRDQDGVLNMELTEKLFEMAHTVALDLGAINIQRSRDHGLPSYNEWRVLCDLEPLKTFEDLKSVISNNDIIKKLKDLYLDVNKIELWVAGILEDIIPGSLLGPTLQCLIATQFKNLRDGDRFWYEYDGVFEPAQLTQIKRVTLARVLCDNGDNITQAQPDVFLRVNHISGYTSCSSKPSIDLRLWKECCSENCYSTDQSFTLSRSISDAKRRKRSSDFDVEVFKDEIDRFSATVDELQTQVFSQQKTLRDIMDKVQNLEKKHEPTVCVDDLGKERKLHESWQVSACKTCVCKELTTECETKICPENKCDNPQISEDQCCPVC